MINNEPLVSVLMTAYNRERFIAEAIESVLASTYTNYELIIVDDGSSDDTVEIIKHYACNNCRLKFQQNEKNLGDYANRNKAVSLATGKYIMFCDSDDMFFPDTIQYCSNAMEKYAEVRFGIYFAGQADQPFLLTSEEVIRKNFFENPILNMGPGGTIINRDFFLEINGYPEKYGPANDMFFNIKAAAKTKVLFLPKLFLNYRTHEGQEKNNLYNYIHFNFRYMDDALKEINLGLSAKNKRYLSNKNSRRFIVNVYNQFKKTPKPATVIDLWKKAGFSVKDLVAGLFH